MKILYTLLFCSFTLLASSQIANDLEIFADDGVLFTLEVNGKQLNEVAANRVFLENTDHDHISVRIRLSGDDEIALERTLPIIFPTSSGEKHPVTAVFRLKRKKNKYKLNLVSRSYKKIQYDQQVRVINEQVIMDERRK